MFMNDNIHLPAPGPDVWTPAYMAIICQAADEIIVSPAQTFSEEWVVWEQLTEEERDRSLSITQPYWQMMREAQHQDRVARSPQSFLNEKVIRRRFGWLRRWVNEWVLMQRQ